MLLFPLACSTSLPFDSVKLLLTSVLRLSKFWFNWGKMKS